MSLFRSDIVFDQFMTIPATQQQFLANGHNKSHFISMLSGKTEKVEVKQADNDADVLFVETAIELFSTTNTIMVIGQNIDILVLLTERTAKNSVVYFLQPGKAQQRTKI